MDQKRKDFLTDNLINSIGKACSMLGKIICDTETSCEDREFAEIKFLTLAGLISDNYEFFKELTFEPNKKNIDAYVRYFQGAMKQIE